MAENEYDETRHWIDNPIRSLFKVCEKYFISLHSLKFNRDSSLSPQMSSSPQILGISSLTSIRLSLSTFNFDFHKRFLHR